MEITTEMVKELRQNTGAGILDCKKMLTETNGNMELAAQKLREKGLAQAAKKVGREAKEGQIGYYIHGGGRAAALIEVNCETDFVARTPEFLELAHDLAMQVVAANPRYISKEDVPVEVLEQEKDVYRKQMQDSDKPAHILERIIEGKLSKFYEEICLLEQPFIKDESKRVSALINEMISKLGENIKVRRFTRYQLGEE